MDQQGATRPDAEAGIFPADPGELGALIREFDWSSTSLGPIDLWPQCLKTATDIILHSPLPLVMLWGPDGVMIYNDAYSEFAGQRHPRLLGSKVLEGWAEVADFNAHVMRVGLAGGRLSFKDQELTLYRSNRAEQVWMDLNYSPVPDESGRPAGVLAIVVETTSRVKAERRSAFLFDVGERLHDLIDPQDVIFAAATRLGQFLSADRVGWANVEAGAGALSGGGEWTRDPEDGCSGNRGGLALTPAWFETLGNGQTLRIDSVGDGPIGLGGGAYAAGLISPLVRDGELSACLYVFCREPRHWGEDEQTLVREVAERTHAALRRVEAEGRVRVSEARLRALVNATSDVVYRMSPDWLEMRQLDGRGFLTDTDGPSVTWINEYLFDEDQPLIVATIQKAIENKATFQLEHRVRRADGGTGWTFSRAIPVLDDQGEITDWFGAASDVTARREAEEHLRLVIHELNHRVKNNLAMIQAISAQTFRNADDLDKAQASFAARVLALAKANDLLTDEHWVDASLREVIQSALRPHCAHAPERCLVEGPPVRLTAKTALSLSMALHELATNAVKYGAWSNDGGQVQVGWTVETSAGVVRLDLEWRESGGPQVAPPQRRGFGSRLIERGLAAELEGDVRLQFEPDGLVCRINAPLRRSDKD